MASIGCKGVDPAPADVDGLLHWYWDNWDAASDAEVAEAIVNTHDALDADAMDGATDGAPSRLTAEQVAFLGRDDIDPALAAGMYLANTYACDLDHLERILQHLAQDELYDVYDAYDRTYTSDHDAYAAGDAPMLTWQVHIEASVLGAEYSEELDGGIRRVRGTDHGDVLITRTWMTEPADFGDSNKEWPQDYQVEVYYERAPDEIVHLYGVWREMFLGSGLSTDDESVQRIILNNLEDWDDETERLCEDGLP